MGRTYPRESENRLAKVGAVTSGGSNHTKTLSTLSTTSISAELHVFGDASTYGVGAAVYSVVRQEDGITQTLVAEKARLAKRELTVPRLELVSAHMATNLVINVRNALKELPEPMIYGWLDSTVTLHWIVGKWSVPTVRL